jgi:hypothetical protein
VTISKTNREQDAANALKLMVSELGEEAFKYSWVDAENELFRSILVTTWRELEERGVVINRGYNEYSLTAIGWLCGIEILGLPEQTEFKSRMSRLSACLKAFVKSRSEHALVEIDDIATSSGLSESFVRNAIESRLLDQVFNIIGAYLAPDDANQHWVVIPINYGHKRQ